jgi:hypothetical protein
VWRGYQVWMVGIPLTVGDLVIKCGGVIKCEGVIKCGGLGSH